MNYLIITKINRGWGISVNAQNVILILRFEKWDLIYWD